MPTSVFCCYNRIPETRKCLKEKGSFLVHGSGGWEVQDWAAAPHKDLMLGRERKNRGSTLSHKKSRNPSMMGLLHDSNTFHKAHLPKLPH
jgi:hypothetical protein